MSETDVVSEKFGGTGGSPTLAICPEGTWITGIGHTADSGGTYAMSFQCSNGQILRPPGGTQGQWETLNCPTGFESIDIRSGQYVDGGQIACGNSISNWGGTGGSLHSFACGQDRVLVGATVHSGTRVDAIQFRCNARAKCSHAENILNGSCPYYCSDPITQPDCFKQVIDSCSQNFTEDCKKFVKQHQGVYEFDTMVSGYCKSHLGDPFCSCYVPFAADETLPKSWIPMLSANPKCWSSTCNLQGYQPAGVSSYCPNLNFQNCLQTTNVVNQGQIQGNVSLKQTAECSQLANTDITENNQTKSNVTEKQDTKDQETKQAVTPSTNSSSSLFTWYWVVFGLVFFSVALLLIGFAVSLSTNSAKEFQDKNQETSDFLPKTESSTFDKNPKR